MYDQGIYEFHDIVILYLDFYGKTLRYVGKVLVFLSIAWYDNFYFFGNEFDQTN